jgi:hypothetical protein
MKSNTPIVLVVEAGLVAGCFGRPRDIEYVVLTGGELKC